MSVLTFLLLPCIVSRMTTDGGGIELMPTEGSLDSLFKRLSVEHERACKKPTSEDPRRSPRSLHLKKDFSCCGSCSYDFDCARYGSCCLGGYENFTHAMTSMQNSRYSCIPAQYLPRQETDYNHLDDVHYWMVNKCDPENSDITSRNLCESPASVLEAVIPVTEPVTDVHYWNKFCAYCNGVDNSMSLIEWNFQLSSGVPLSFPKENFLLFLRETKGNIFFKPPEYLNVPKCKPSPSYTTETCNETGLWSTFDDGLETACRSFLDPFNNTYKNYFCFLCNLPESLQSDYLLCSANSTVSSKSIFPLYSSIVNPHVIVQEESNDRLICGNEQFKDDIMMVCRDVFCRNFYQLRSGKCTISDSVRQEHCSAMFIKLSVTTEATLQMTDPQDYYFKRDLLEEFEHIFGLRNVTQTFTVFYKLDVSNLIEYVVLYVTFDFIDTNESYHVLSSLMQLNYLQLDFAERYVRFSVEFAVYNMSYSDQDVKIVVPTSFNTSDELDTIFSPFTVGDASCSQKETVLINKLHFCPYIILHTNEIQAMVGKGLVFSRETMDDTRPLKLLTEWEYERNGSDIHICLEDYFDIYNAMITHKEDPTSDSDRPKLLVYMFLISTYLFLI